MMNISHFQNSNPTSIKIEFNSRKRLNWTRFKNIESCFKDDCIRFFHLMAEISDSFWIISRDLNHLAEFLFRMSNGSKKFQFSRQKRNLFLWNCKYRPKLFKFVVIISRKKHFEVNLKWNHWNDNWSIRNFKWSRWSFNLLGWKLSQVVFHNVI